MGQLQQRLTGCSICWLGSSWQLRSAVDSQQLQYTAPGTPAMPAALQHAAMQALLWRRSKSLGQA